jgi:PAS domain S-box-containing protein
MVPRALGAVSVDDVPQLLWDDGERVFRRGWLPDGNGARRAVFVVALAAEHPSRSSLDRLVHEYELKDQLDAAWAAQPLELLHGADRTTLILDDAGGEPLSAQLGPPLDIDRFLQLAIAIAAAIGKLHQRGLVHKDVKPSNILVNGASGEVRLTGFGITSRLTRERNWPTPPETIAGTLAYMAPEQTGRMNRSIDSRSDLYALGVTFYQLLTGALPFAAADAMEWVHCHLARKPVAPAEQLKTVPGAISALVMKLLAKMAEDRYQTASGLETDLRRCEIEWKAKRKIDDFPLGEHDTPSRLLIPEKLYGRRTEIETMLACLDRMVSGGAPELVLVSGYSGIGKSSVVNEIHRMLPAQGLFASGKCDQYKRDIPYATLAQAFQNLIRPLLGKNESELAHWRNALQQALGENAALIADLVPGVKIIIGEPPPALQLPPQDTQQRFRLVFRQFIGVFTRPEHPLVLFLDDLQWLDAATLDLLEELLSRSDLTNLLLIGSYRDNEVTASHPLLRKLETIRASRRVQDIKLGPLTIDELRGLVSEALRVDADQAIALAELIHSKTDGNPFFVIQFLHALADEGLLTFDRQNTRWILDLHGIQAKQYTDNVIDLLAGKLTRLPLAAQKALQWFACLGNVADTTTLSVIVERSEDDLHAALWDARRQQMVDRLDRSYRFVHDRVQEAAYEAIAAESRAEMHLTIGRLLLRHTPPERREERLFEIVNQLNRGGRLMTSNEEREQLAELNLAAGRRAAATSAYTSALTYLAEGRALLSDDAWERRQELAFALDLQSADCTICLGDLQIAAKRLEALGERATDTVQRCSVARRRVELYTMMGDAHRAVAVGLEYLRLVGIDWPAHPNESQALNEYERIWSGLRGRTIEQLIDLPFTDDAQSLATLDLLAAITVPTHYTDAHLNTLNISRAVNLCLERGNCDAAPVSYSAMGVVASARFGHLDEGYRLGKMACDLIDRHGLKHFGAGRTYFNFAVLTPWTRPFGDAIDPARRAFQTAKSYGHPTFAALSSRTIVSVLIASGHPLDQVEREAEEGREFALPYGPFLDRLSAPLALVRTLRGKTATFGSLDNEGFTERAFEQAMTGQPTYAYIECYYWIRKLQARLFAGDHTSALDAARRAEGYYAISPTLSLFLTELADFHFYAALARASCCEPIGTEAYEDHRRSLAAHERTLQTWATNCPHNFEARAALVGAEVARIEARPIEAMNLYERAITSARATGAVHDEALACELASRFYAASGFEEIANLYLGGARRAYLRWGADGKVRQLDQLHPQLRRDQRAPGPTGIIEAPVEQLDLATVIEVSQALSGEIVLDKLVQKLLSAAVEHAGAERGLLIRLQDGKLRVDAEATPGGERASVQFLERDTSAPMPESLIRYVARTREILVLDDASASQSSFAMDPDIVERRARSIACLPLINHGELIGILYLENNLMPRVFTPKRMTVLKILASQAAISLENTRLYGDLADREAKIRRLVDANIIGIFVADRDDRILEANDAFLRIIGYDREDLAGGRLRWGELSPPEWRERDRLTRAQLDSMGALQPYEKEYLRKDGIRVPVLVGAALFKERGEEGVAFVLDLTERKRTENALRESEERFRDYAETASDWLWEMGPDHKLTMLTPNAFGSSPSARIGTAAWERALDLETEPEKWRTIQAAMDAHEPFRDFVYLAAGFDGSPMYVRASGKPVFDADGKFLGYRGVGTDATAVIRAQEALRSAIDGIPGLVGVLGPNGDVEAVNRQILAYCGQPLEELRNWGTNGIVHQDDLPHVAEVFSKSIASGIPYQIEQRMRRFDGEYRWFDNRGVPVRDQSGRIVRWYVLLTDIEDRTHALARLQQMQADFARMNRVSVMGELAASLSHEITQPIASARNNARAAQNFMNMQPPEMDEVREALACVVGDTDRARDIIDRIRDHIRKAPPRKDGFDLNEAINEVITLARSTTNRNGVLVQTSLSDGVGHVLGDRVQLQQVLLNLILNAAEAMGLVEEGARDLVISTEQDQAGVLVAVRDTGSGIDPGHLDRVFDAFYTTKSGGTGMGLSICRSIIEAHGGRLWAEANEPRGAVLRFTLPGTEAELTNPLRSSPRT